MSGSKKWKSKECAYCGCPSSTNDHVIAKSFFLPRDRSGLPQVPACLSCNRRKERLESYVTVALLCASNHVDGDEFRATILRQRLAKNARVYRRIGLNDPPQWVSVNGILQKMHLLKLDGGEPDRLLAMIVQGLFRWHWGERASADYPARASLHHPDAEPQFVSMLEPAFRGGDYVKADLGRGAFIYSGVRSPQLPGMSMWQMAIHGGITIHGKNTPPEGVSHWWGFTWPTTDELVRLAPNLSERLTAAATRRAGAKG